MSKESLDAIQKAICELHKDTSLEDERHNLPKDIQICSKGKILCTDVSLTVENVGKLEFPLKQETVKKLIQISTKAKFGSLSESLLDTNVRDTQVIPASQLKIVINQKAITTLMENIKAQLNIYSKGTLVPHIFNMLIYAPGQFFLRHRDTEKFENMVATLVLVLPSVHKGGALHMYHGETTQVFSHSDDPTTIDYVSFHSDCEHEVTKVTKGFRVALTYNVELQLPPFTPNDISNQVNERLNDAISRHFSQNSQPKRYIFFFDYNYSEHTLKWHMLKGRDRNTAHALFAVAKNQGLRPYLALADCEETFTESDYHGPDKVAGSIDLYCCFDENNSKIYQRVKLGFKEMSMECRRYFNSWNVAYKKKEIGWYGNGPAKREFWYKWACIVLSK